MRFIELYHDHLLGVLEGLDRIRFRGTDRMLSNARGFGLALHTMGVLYKDFKAWAQKTTQELRRRCAEQAHRLGIETIYLRRSGEDKDALACEVVRERGVAKDGSICMFSVVEGCEAPTVVADRISQHLEVKVLPRKCVFVYHYFDDPQLGFGHVRLQTWAPYTAHICLNGRHWLEKQLLARDVPYLKVGNCFPWVGDLVQAQACLDEQLQTRWPELLNRLVDRTCPDLFGLCRPFELKYYWSADETEYATDLLFKSKAELDALFPHLVLHGMRVSDCHEVLRYFGMRAETRTRGKAPHRVATDCRRRYEGVRIKHRVHGNSEKLYNKAGTVLRAEATVNNPRAFKAFRPARHDEAKPATWQRMGKGVNDLHRRCEVSRQANARYLDALSAVRVEQTLREVAQTVCRRTRRHGRSVRALNPWGELDLALLRFLAQGQWALNGFRNADLCRTLDPACGALALRDRRRLAAKASRLIGMLRAHGLVHKVPREHRYLLTDLGQTLATALLAASDVSIQRLTELAA